MSFTEVYIRLIPFIREFNNLSVSGWVFHQDHHTEWNCQTNKWWVSWMLNYVVDVFFRISWSHFHYSNKNNLFIFMFRIYIIKLLLNFFFVFFIIIEFIMITRKVHQLKGFFFLKPKNITMAKSQDIRNMHCWIFSFILSFIILFFIFPFYLPTFFLFYILSYTLCYYFEENMSYVFFIFSIFFSTFFSVVNRNWKLSFKKMFLKCPPNQKKISCKKTICKKN